MKTPSNEAFDAWLAALERRQREALSFAEVRRGLQALSSLYVERRGRLATGSALEGRGKRAAFALYYGPLHFLTVREIVRGLGAAQPAPARILDLGCGTGAAGAAWATEAAGVRVDGIDCSGWAVEEARWTLSRLGIQGTARKGDLRLARLPPAGGAVLAAFTLNELPEADREALLGRLIEAARSRRRVLVVEPIARRLAPWWERWAAACAEAGGRADAWRFRVELPRSLALLDKAAGLDHRELTARSLYLGY